MRATGDTINISSGEWAEIHKPKTFIPSFRPVPFIKKTPSFMPEALLRGGFFDSPKELFHLFYWKKDANLFIGVSLIVSI